MSNTAERRFTSVRVEVRATSDNGKRTIGGYAAKFNRTSQNLGGFREIIAPGAFNRSRSQNWPGVVARYNHDDNMLLGTTGARTLRLDVDDVGLPYEVDLPDARADVHELVTRGDVSQSSFAFIADDDDWTTDDSGFPLRTLKQARILDVAPVNSPAYLDTSVDARSLAGETRTIAGALVGPENAYRSLSEKFDLAVEEVRAMAAVNELTRLFKRTDGPPSPKSVSPHMVLATAAALAANR